MDWSEFRTWQCEKEISNGDESINKACLAKWGVRIGHFLKLSETGRCVLSVQLCFSQ